MKPKAISGITCFVKNLETTTDFYEKLGFRFSERVDNIVKAYINWFWIEFATVGNDDKKEFKEEDSLANKGAGVYLCASVEDVDEFYKYVVSEGLKPACEPRKTSLGATEFIIHDPDGYKLAFFQKK